MTEPSTSSDALGCAADHVHWAKILVYFLVGFGLLFALQYIYAFRFGDDWTRLLHMEETSRLRPFLEADLGHVSIGTRHDGQVNYALARRPFGDPAIHPFVDPAGFRYRRWLYPLLSGGFGTFSPRTTLWGLILLASMGAGACSAAIGTLAERYRLSPLLIMVILAHPGIWITCEILTGDTVTMTFALWGLIAWIVGRERLAIVLFMFMCLGKEVYGLVPFGIALWEVIGRKRWKHAVALCALPPIPLIVWVTSFRLRFPEPGGGFSAWGDLDWPLFGLIKATRIWPQTATDDVIYSFIALAGVLACLWTALTSKHLLLRCLAWPWVALSLILSDWIWNLGTDSIRGLLPMWIIAGFHIATRFSGNRSSSDASGGSTSDP